MKHNLYRIWYSFCPDFLFKKYQEECRFYLDEYPEQEKLREEWFKKRNSDFLTQRFLRRQ